MLKNLFILMFMLASYYANVYADDTTPIRIPIESSHGNNSSGEFHRSPVRLPEVYLDTETKTLLFTDAMYECSISLLSSSGDEVYSSIIPDGSTEFQLPSNLSGEYELRITRGIYIFVGTIEI